MVTSPNSNIKWFLNLDEKGAMSYQVTVNNRPFILPSDLGFEEKSGLNLKDGFQVVLVIPASAIFRHDIGDLNGKTMRANFYKCGDLLQAPHFLSWSPIDLPQPKFHYSEFFGELMLDKALTIHLIARQVNLYDGQFY